VTWQHVPRSRNRRADALANRAMDAQGKLRRPAGRTSSGSTGGSRPVQGELR
jgi:ribonuclease HI